MNPKRDPAWQECVLRFFASHPPIAHRLNGSTDPEEALGLAIETIQADLKTRLAQLRLLVRDE